MNILSLFDGISCGQLALERAGIKYTKYFASEINEKAISVTQRNFPETVQVGDITKLDLKTLPPIDMIIGGSPCQGFSFAGKQLNFEDPRSKLFFEYVRIKEELNPKYFLLENVVMKKEYSDLISGVLGVTPIKINSALVSAQNRNRLYWCNWETSQPVNKRVLLNDVLDGEYYSTRDKAYCIDANYNKGSNFKRYFFRGSRQIVLEKGYTPRVMTEETANSIMHEDGNRWRLLSPEECEVLQNIPRGYTGSIPKGHRYNAIGNGWTVDIVSHLFKEIEG